MSNTNPKKTFVYVYELPYTERKELCDIIDMNDKWEELGGKYMEFDCATLFRLSKAPMRNHSPTDELLSMWGVQNHTILELFIILHKMQHYRSMTILQPFVEQKYHKLIYQGDKNFSNLVKSETGNTMQNETCNLIKLNTDSDQKKANNQGNQDLNLLGKKNEPIYSDPSVTFSSAEACTPLITYNELEQATNYWNKSNILGKGGFGIVFKGIWKNTAVAIKRLETQKRPEQEFNILEAQRQQSLRELKYLNSCRHDNILSLYGFSIGGEKPCLVYQYMVNGSLEDRLQCRQETKPLSWYVRFKIATGSARGLQFLHGMDKPLVHGDIKSANILLDPYFEPRIGDFGLAREGPLQEYTHVKVSHVHGTRPYLPDEFLRGNKFSTKVDTYSFGVVLFEIATGQRAYDSLRHHKFLKDHVENYDGSLLDMADLKAGKDEHNVYHSLISIGKNCVSYRAKDRPEMEQVLRQLEQLDCVILQEKHQSTIRHSCMPTFQYEMQVRKLSIPSGSYHPQPWLFSHVPSNQLLKPHSSLVPHFGAVTVPDQIEEASKSPVSTRFADASMPIVKSSSTKSQLTNSSDKDSTNISHFIESDVETSVENQNSAWINSIPRECDELPLISKLQVQPNDDSHE